MASKEVTNHYSALLKEAYFLSVEISKMNQKIDADLRKQNGELAYLIHQYDEWKDDSAQNLVTGQAIEKGADKVVFDPIKKRLIEIIAKIAKVSVPVLEKAGERISWITNLLTPANSGQEWARDVYLDDKPELAKEYYTKADRLAQITKELMVDDFSSMSVPLDLKNTCAVQACWLSR
jgi:hypothetical protein